LSAFSRAMKRSEQIDALAAALANAQGQMEGATKASENPFYKHKYADLASVWGACRDPLANNGLAIIQTATVAPPEIRENVVLSAAVTVTTLLAHNSGQWIEDELRMWPKENTPQAIGTCISYARRYSLAAMVGVYQEDDDAEHAMGRGPSTMETATAGLGDVLDAIRIGDAKQMRSVWNEANVLGTSGAIWKVLNTKQKKTARDLLQATEPPSKTAATEPPANGNGETP
ncbi:MAG TPA: ERF family protein, partial [Steroidobacteraceae bacterium]